MNLTFFLVMDTCLRRYDFILNLSLLAKRGRRFSLLRLVFKVHLNHQSLLVDG